MKHRKICFNSLLYFCLLLLILAGAVRQSCAADKSDSHKHPNVLFLSSYSYEWESIPKQLSGITETLNGRAKVSYVFMDTKRLKYEDIKEKIYNDIYLRAAKNKFDYVIAGDDAALHFALEYYDRLFKDIPIIFEGIDDEDFARSSAQDKHITGIVETFQLKDTIALATSLNPEATRVVGIADDTISGRGSTKQFMNCKSSFPGMTFSVIDCSVMTRAEIGRAISAYGKDTILVYLIMTADADGNTYSSTEATQFVASKSNIPVFEATGLGIGNGILGGIVVSFSEMAADAAKIVLALGNGLDIADYPIKEAKHYCIFDKEVMDKFGITKEQVSDAYDGIIRYANDKPTFFEAHEKVILPMGTVILLLVLFSIFTISVIANKKSLMKDLGEKEMMLHSLLDNIPGGVAIYRVRGATQDLIETIYSSEGIPRLSGRTMDEYLECIKGGLFVNSVSEEDLPMLQASLEKSLPEKKPFSVTYHLKHKNGSKVFLSLAATWAYDERDGSSIYYAVYIDETAHEKARQAESDSIKAKAADQAKGEFLSRMSHDMRTPLNAVLGFAKLAKDEPDVPAKTSRYLDKIQSSGDYLLALINDILDMTKIESGKVELHEENVDARKFLEGIADVFRAQAGEKGITLVTDFADAHTQWIKTDPLRTRQIFANLLSNAIKFSESGTKIQWTVKDSFTTADTLYFVSTISDQGRGMSKEFMSKMFDPFTQEGDPASETGTGLGLPIVKNLLALMGGTISAESEPGKGTTFTVEMERKIGSPQKTESEKQELNSALSGKHVLLCEDNEINAEISRELLKRVGCTMDCAENGKIGVEKFAASQPGYYSAILMDILMPVMNGLEAAKAIRATDRPDAGTIPIIAISANAFSEDIQKSLAAGMNAHISKPIVLADFYNTIEKYISSAPD